MKLALTIAFFFFSFILSAQENSIVKKELKALRIEEKITIDGLINEPAMGTGRKSQRLCDVQTG
ncbi:MAG: hypothetical protein U5K51_04230 [Flavobacteriaceae bacterium]|nr:hypothetical protein [Flavobacteriaceae bacterium]